MPRLWRKVLRTSRRRQERQRIERHLDCTWLSQWGEERCRISSLSPTGCYIDSRFTTPAVGTVVQDITILLATGDLVLQGTVLDSMRGVGFAVRFTDVDEETRYRLSVLVQDLHTTVEDRIGGCTTPALR